MKRLVTLVILVLAASHAQAGAPVATTILTDSVPPYLLPSSGAPVPIGGTATRTVVLSKGTGGTPRITLFGLAPGSDFQITGGTCVAGVTTFVNPADSCTIDLEFSPTASGPRAGTLTVDCQPVVVIGGISITCDLDSQSITNIALSGLGALLASWAVPAVGRHELTALALLLFALAAWSMRRKP